LAKSLDGGKVIPLLFELELRDISGPLAQFQAKKFDADGLTEVVNSINRALPSPISEEILTSLLSAMWPSFQQKIDAVPKREGHAKSTRTQAEILEELVAGVRTFDSRLRDTEMVMYDQNVRQRKRKKSFFMPMLLDVASSMGSKDPIGLLIVAGVLREDMPWLSEVLVEMYREILRGGSRSIGRHLERLHRLTRIVLRGPFIEEMGGSKEHHMIAVELPDMLEEYLRNLDFPPSVTVRRNLEKEKQDAS